MDAIIALTVTTIRDHHCIATVRVPLVPCIVQQHIVVSASLVMRESYIRVC